MRGSQLFGLILEPDFDFIPWKLTDTRPRDRCSRTQLALLPLRIFLRDFTRCVKRSRPQATEYLGLSSPPHCGISRVPGPTYHATFLLHARLIS
jgi:hypothetical protein